MNEILNLLSLRRCAALFILTLGLSTDALSDESKISIIVMDQVPYGFQSAAGTPTGVLFEIAELARNNTNLFAPVSIVPTKRIPVLLNSNKKVCTIVANTPDIAGNYDLVETIGIPLSAGILPASGVAIPNYESLKDIIIAVPLGIQFDDKFHNDDTLNKISVPQYSNAMKMLRRGRVQAIAGAIPSLTYVAKLQGMNSNDLGTPLLFFTVELFLTCNSRITRTERAELKSTIKRLKADGQLSRIIDAYFSIK